MKAMILAAGLGTRLKPWTDHHPKALAVVNGKSLVQRNIEYLQQFGISDVLVNVHHFADQIIDAVEKNNGWGSKVTISDETDEVLETGGGLKKAAWYFEGASPFILMNVDILTSLDLGTMIAAHQSSKPLATLAISERKTSRYFLFDNQQNLRGWRNVQTGEEKPAGISTTIPELKQMAFSGIHIIDPSLLTLMERDGKFSMVDVYLDLSARHTILGYDHTGAVLVDVGKPESIIKAEEIFP
ncbi:MAG: NTP transferase domain-containing protein [Chitinophagaceae bacterium]|nr:NTP transferase domain-containing protein [Chitinophagaceae bacterium]